VPVHGAAPALLTPTELGDELRLDEELVQLLLGVSPARRGLVGSADVDVLEQAGIDFVLAPPSAPPLRVGERLLALPALQLDGAALDPDGDAVSAAITELRDGGWAIAGADAIAAELTPPWLERGALAADALPPALAALASLTGWCVDAFGLSRVPGVAAAALLDEAWRLERFPARARLPLTRRRGLTVGRRAWVAAFELCDVLALEMRVPGATPRPAWELDGDVWPRLAAVADAHGAGDPFARARAAFRELRAFRFSGAGHWRALLGALRDAFALLASRRAVDWTVAPRPDEADDAATIPVVRVDRLEHYDDDAALMN
jgi:hypothetical protein